MYNNLLHRIEVKIKIKKKRKMEIIIWVDTPQSFYRFYKHVVLENTIFLKINYCTKCSISSQTSKSEVGHFCMSCCTYSMMYKYIVDENKELYYTDKNNQMFCTQMISILSIN